MRSSTSAGTGCAVAMLLGRMDLTQAAAERGFCLGLGLATGYFLRPLPGGAKVQLANCLAFF